MDRIRAFPDEDDPFGLPPIVSPISANVSAPDAQCVQNAQAGGADDFETKEPADEKNPD